MIIEPKIRNNICLTAHPTGCALQVRDMIRATKQRKKLAGPKAALIIGASNGYGMGARVAAAYGCGAATLGIAFERPSSETKVGTAGYYNDRAFLAYAAEDGIPAWSLNGDAFAEEMKREALDLIRGHLAPAGPGGLQHRGPEAPGPGHRHAALLGDQADRQRPTPRAPWTSRPDEIYPGDHRAGQPPRRSGTP